MSTTVGLLLCAGLLVAVSMSGCLSGARAYDLEFSPDGQSLAYRRDEGWFFGILAGPPLLGVGSGRGESCWLEVTRPEEVHRVPILKVTLSPFYRPRPGEMVDRDTKTVFSPDSRHTAQVLKGSGDIVIISRDGKHWRLPEAHDVRGVSWASSEEVVYMNIVREKGDHGPESQTLVVWRQGVVAPFHRREICRSEAGWFKCFLCPSSGGNLLLYEYYRGGRYRVVDLASGKMVDLAPDGERLRSVAWSTDGSKLFLVTDDREIEPLPSGKWQVTIHYTAFDTKTNRRSGWSETYEMGADDPQLALAFRWTADNPLAFASLWTADDPQLALAFRWTADDRYVVLREFVRGWCLLDPWKRERVPLSEKFAPHLQRVNAEEVTHVGTLPFEGWIWVSVRLRGPDEGYQVFAMDYSGEHFVHLPGGEVVSPDGKYVAEGDGHGRVKISTLTLPRGEQAR